MVLTHEYFGGFARPKTRWYHVGSQGTRRLDAVEAARHKPHGKGKLLVVQLAALFYITESPESSLQKRLVSNPEGFFPGV